jgi:hypothetical protein
VAEVVTSTIPTEQDRETFLEMLARLEEDGNCSERFHDLGAKLFGDPRFQLYT